MCPVQEGAAVYKLRNMERNQTMTGMITEIEYVAAQNKLMDKYLVIRDLENQVA